MQKLRELVFLLHESENLMLDRYYNAQSRGKLYRRPELIKLMREGKIRTNKDAATFLHSSKPSTALYNLKKRLREDIINIILISGGTTGVKMTYLDAGFYCRKQLAVGDELLHRGSTEIAIKLLQEAAVVAKKYELIAEYISCMDLLRTSLGFRKGIKVYNNYTKAIEAAFDLHKDILTAQSFSKQVGLTGMFTKNKQKEFESFALTRQKELKELYERTKSPNVGYWYLRTSVYYFQIIKDFANALIAAKELLILVKKEQAVRSDAKLGFVNIQIANILLERGEFKAAMKVAIVAKNSYFKKQVNYLQCLEQLFVASIYAGDKKVAKEVVKLGLSHRQLKANSFINAKWIFYKANLAFINKDFHQVIKILRFQNELTKDTGGWLIGYKLLEILALAELNEKDIIENRLGAFKQFLRRVKRHHSITRYKLIADLLSSLIKNNLSYKEVVKKNNRKIILLQKGEGDYYWDPVAFEIIRFDNWLLNAAKE